MDELVRSSSQLVAAIAEQSADLRHSTEIQRMLREFQTEMGRLRRQWVKSLRHLREDAAVTAAFQGLDELAGRFDSLARHSRAGAHTRLHRTWTLQQLGSRVYRDACRARVVPAGSVFDAFGSMVRELARGEGKDVEFQFRGHEVEADRLVLQRLKDPVMHLLRNAVSHGVEPPGERAAAGKRRTGSVELRVAARGSRLRITVQDDGRGIDTTRVAEVAVSNGLISEAEAAARPPQELARLILRPGLSTAPAVSRLSGRGMGMSVVQEQVTALGGEVLLRQEPGRGTAVTLAVPLSISTHHVLLVASGKHTFALPAYAVGRLCRVRTENIETVEGTEAVRIEGRALRLARLADIIENPGAAPARENGAAAPVVVLRSGEGEVGLVVDEFIDEREAVVKDTGLSVSQAGMSAGAVMLDGGGVAVVLNPAALMARFRKGVRSPGLKADAAEAAKPKPKVLVVDDSITTRSLEKSILEAHGYDVRVAVDGVEALAALQAQPADLVITDVMMPRMDGFQLLEQIKKDARLAGTPVIVVTSLERPEEQERGLSLGADAYIVKRKFDQRELLNTVRQIL
jgi:two-component system chemotaxis sensor kinase CheA